MRLSLHLLSRQLQLDLCNSRSGVEALRASARAVEDGVAAEYAHLVLQLLPALGSSGILVAVSIGFNCGAEHARESPPTNGMPA